MEVINAGMRKVIKGMCVAAQTLQFISLMPKPKDFVTRIVGDVVYLSAKIQKLSEDMNKLLDSYTDIPTNYLMTQMNSITGSLTGITNRLNTYAQNGVNQVIGLGENVTGMITELTGSAIDITGSLTSAVVGLGSAVAETSEIVLSNTETAADIHDATEVILEWTNNGFNVVNENVTSPVKKVTQKLIDTKTGMNKKIQNTADAVNDKIESAQKLVEALIRELKEKMDKLSNIIDTGFKDVTGLTSVSRGATGVVEALKEADDNSPAAQATSAMASSLATVIKNFSIGKMVTAFAGVITQSAIVRLGLDKLPPIDFESMMCKIRDDMTISTKEIYRYYTELSDSAYKDLVDLGVESEYRDYSSKNYDEFVKEFDEDLKKKRDDIRILMKNANVNDRGSGSVNKEINDELRSAISEIKKYRKKIKQARQADTLKTVIGNELGNFRKEVEYRCNSIKSDWHSMMKQYQDAIAEIREFFSNGGSGDMFITDCCKQINQDFDEIKELCKNLGTQLVASGIKIFMPADIGPVVPNPVYKISDFWMDIKTIIKFIKDLITLIIDIINHINKLARIMLNGLNDLVTIIRQLMEMIGLKWLMNLVQNIIDMFGNNIDNAYVRLANSLSPVYFSDTDIYNNTLEVLEQLVDGEKFTDEKKSYLTEAEKALNDIGNSKLQKNITKIKNKSKISDSDKDDIDKIIEDLEEEGETIVAYKSPILKQIDPDNYPSVSDLVDGNSINNDIKFAGWEFYHPDLSHEEAKDYYNGGVLGKLFRKIKSKIIKKASKRSHKKNGGVAMLNNKKVGSKIFGSKVDTAKKAFYWYTYYTEDLEKDCFEGGVVQDSVIIDNVVQTENGSVVELSDGRKVFVANNMVRKGDYVTVDGVKYRVGGAKVK